MLTVASERMFGVGCVTLGLYRLVGRLPNTTRGLPRLGGAMYVYMSEGWFHSFGVFGFWLVGGFGVCGPQVCWLQKQDGCTYSFTFALRSITVGDVSSLEGDLSWKRKKEKKEKHISRSNLFTILFMPSLWTTAAKQGRQY